jgi:hypothetical protein
MAEQRTEALRAVGRCLAAEQSATTGSARERTEQDAAMLGELGRVADVEGARNRCLLLKGRNCPLAETIEANADACNLAEPILADPGGASRLRAGPSPRCHFQISDGSE